MDDVGLTRVPSECKLPKSTLAAMIKEILPPDLRCGTTARELVMECAMEFLQLLSSQAAEECNKEKKSKIVTHHVEGALRSLKFEQYLPDMLETEAEFKESQAKRPKLTSRLDGGGISSEELQRQQKALFAKSKVAYQVSLSRTNSDAGLSRNDIEAQPQLAAQPAASVDNSRSALAGGIVLSLVQKEVADALRGDEEGSDDDYDNL